MTAAAVHPLPVAEPEFALHPFALAHVRESDEADVQTLAAEIAAEVPESCLRVALGQALLPYLRRTVSDERRRRYLPGSNESSRWGDVQRAARSGALAIYRWRVSVGNEDWKFFADCTQPEVAEVAKGMKQRAIEMADQGQRFDAVAKLMQELKAETVQAVPVERLVEIFNA